MSELNNPLFENQKEFLERQKQEYKKALLSDVQEIKSQSQKVGKTLLIAGGALAGLWMVSSLVRGKKKSKHLKAAPVQELQTQMLAQPGHNQGPTHQQGAFSTTYYPAPSAFQQLTQSFLQSDLAKAISQQVTAFLLIYITKKIEEYLQQHAPETLVTSQGPETKDIDFSYHQEDAVQ